MAVLGANEMAVVAMGVTRKMAVQVIERLRKAVERSMADSAERASLRLGAATYGTRVRHPNELLRSARASLHGASPPDVVGEKEEFAA